MSSSIAIRVCPLNLSDQFGLLCWPFFNSWGFATLGTFDCDMAACNTQVDRPLHERESLTGLRDRMNDAVFSARQQIGLSDCIQFPWEQGSLAQIFTCAVSKMVPPPGYGDSLLVPEGAGAGDAPASSSVTMTVFDRVIRFGSRRTKTLPDEVQCKLLHERWWLVLNSNPFASSVGRMFAQEDNYSAVEIVGQALGGKSVGALRKRLSQIQRYIKCSCQSGRRLSVNTSRAWLTPSQLLLQSRDSWSVLRLSSMSWGSMWTQTRLGIHGFLEWSARLRRRWTDLPGTRRGL